MARPAYREDQKTARQKLVDAFWESLAAGTLSKLNVSAICARTGLNRNSFYYHFDSMSDLAQTVVEGTLEKDLPALMVAHAGEGAGQIAAMLDSNVYAQEFDRICLVASANSTPALQAQLKSALSKIWCGTLGIDLATLSPENRAIFEFCLGGVMSLLAMRHDAGVSVTMGDMLKTDFAREMFASVTKLARK